MHPADVADYVAVSVGQLRDRLQRYPKLEAGEPALDAHTLRIPFVKLERALVGGQLPSGLVVPGSEDAVFTRPVQVIDLGQPPVRRQLILQMDLADFDSQPPTAELVLPDLTPLPRGEWPRALGNQGVVDGHPDYDRPFFCRRGLREYHSHAQHEDDPWDRYREELSLDSIVLELLVDLRDRWIGR